MHFSLRVELSGRLFSSNRSLQTENKRRIPSACEHLPPLRRSYYLLIITGPPYLLFNLVTGSQTLCSSQKRPRALHRDVSVSQRVFVRGVSYCGLLLSLLAIVFFFPSFFLACFRSYLASFLFQMRSWLLRQEDSFWVLLCALDASRLASFND